MKLVLFIIIVFCFYYPSPVSAFTNAQPIGQTGSWNLIFEDNFDGTTLNLNVWQPNWFGSTDTTITNPINTLEKNCYNPANVSVSNGILSLTTVPNTLGSTCQIRGGSTATYSSGMISSNPHGGGNYEFSYGYVEASIWNPAGLDHQSVWPAFWTAGQPTWPTNGEIDIMECYGTDASCSYHYHYFGCPANNPNCTAAHQGPGGNATVVGSTTGWHTYAADWEPGVITWYYDGKQVWQYTTGVVSSPHYLMLNLGTYGTKVDTTIPAKSVMKVDYVRVWEKSPTTVSPQPNPSKSPSPSPSPSPTPPTTKSGDLNNDGFVDGNDYVFWLNYYSPTGPINGQSYVTWLNNYHT